MRRARLLPLFDVGYVNASRVTQTRSSRTDHIASTLDLQYLRSIFLVIPVWCARRSSTSCRPARARCTTLRQDQGGSALELIVRAATESIDQTRRNTNQMC